MQKMQSRILKKSGCKLKKTIQSMKYTIMLQKYVL